MLKHDAVCERELTTGEIEGYTKLINAFTEKIVLIAGGSDKNISYTPLAKPIAKKVSKLIL